MSKMVVFGQFIGGMFFFDEIVKGLISGYVFEQFEIVCYIFLLVVVEKVGDIVFILVIEVILVEEWEMVDWLIKYIFQIMEQFFLCLDVDGVEVKK